MFDNVKSGNRYRFPLFILKVYLSKSSVVMLKNSERSKIC